MSGKKLIFKARFADQSSLAILAMAGAVATWGCSNVAIKAISTTGLVASFYRLWFAAALLWTLTAVTPSLRRRMDRNWLNASLIGGSLFGLHQVLFFNCVKLTSVANVTIIGSLQPVLVLLVAGRAFGERTSWRGLGWSLLAMAGTVIVIVGSAGSPSWSPFGDLVAVANLFAFTAYFLVSKRLRTHIGASEYVVGMTTVAGFWILLACLLTGQQLGSPRGWDWLLLAGIAVLPGTLGHFLTNWAHRHASAFIMSIMMLAIPIIASALAAVFLGEMLRAPQIAGGVTVLVAIGAIISSRETAPAGEWAESAAET